LFVVLYAASWLWQWLREGIAPASNPYADLDRAWDVPMQVLRTSARPPEQFPFYLVLGAPRRGHADFLRSGGVNFHLESLPDAPFQVHSAHYDGRDALFVFWPTPPDDGESRGDRFRHLLGRIRSDRSERIPLNGVIVFVSSAGPAEPSPPGPAIAGTAKSEAANLLKPLQGRAEELAAIRETIGVQCPCWIAFCDLEETAEFQQFQRRLKGARADKHDGKPVPGDSLGGEVRLPPGLDRATALSRLRMELDRFFNEEFPTRVHDLFCMEGDTNEIVPPDNQALFELASGWQRRWKWIDAQCVEMLLTLRDPPADEGDYEAGCYLTATTGLEPGHGDASFVDGFLERVFNARDLAVWNQSTQTADAITWRWKLVATIVFLPVITALFFTSIWLTW
jgi:hypothetical protein